MFFWRISSISLLFSLLLYNFVNCNIYMIARSSLKNNCLYEIYCIFRKTHKDTCGFLPMREWIVITVKI